MTSGHNACDDVQAQHRSLRWLNSTPLPRDYSATNRDPRPNHTPAHPLAARRVKRFPSVKRRPVSSTSCVESSGSPSDPVLIFCRSSRRGSSPFCSRSSRATASSPAHEEVREVGAPSIPRRSRAKEIVALTHPHCEPAEMLLPSLELFRSERYATWRRDTPICAPS